MESQIDDDKLVLRLYFISLEILVTKAIFDQPIGNEYYGGRKKRFRHGLNRVIQNKDDNDETTILYTNDEGHESTGQKRKKQYFLTNNANDPQLQLPDRFSVLNFQTHHDKDEWTSQFDNEEALEENKSKLAFWGRLYLDGFPFPMQYFRAHFGLPPPKGYFDFILIHTNEICIKGNETQHREIYANTVIVSERGTCSFSDKALTAFGLGAKAILFINNEVGNIHPSGPRAHDANISVSMISKSDGNLVYDAFQKSNKLRGYFIPILCDRNEKEGMLCEPFRKLDINLVQNITYDGDIFLVDDTIDRDRGQRFKYLQGTFGGQVINKVWSLVDAPIYDPYACKDIKDNNTTKKLNGFAVLVKRGKCDFGQKAQVLADAGAGMMILSNDEDSLTRMGYDSRKYQYMPRIAVIMIPQKAGLHFNRLLNNHKHETKIFKIMIKRSHERRKESENIKIDSDAIDEL